MIAQKIDAGEVDGPLVSRIVAAMSRISGFAEMLADADEVGLLAGLVERRRQQRGLQAVRAIVDDPRSTEDDIQRVLPKEWWIFGGRYIARAKRRTYTVLNQFDIPLIRADGSFT